MFHKHFPNVYKGWTDESTDKFLNSLCNNWLNSTSLESILEYRFPSLYARDRDRKNVLAYNEFADKKTRDDCKLEDRSRKMTNSQSHIREIADKKTTYNEGRLYLHFSTLWHQHWAKFWQYMALRAKSCNEKYEVKFHSFHLLRLITKIHNKKILNTRDI